MSEITEMYRENFWLPKRNIFSPLYQMWAIVAQRINPPPMVESFVTMARRGFCILKWARRAEDVEDVPEEKFTGIKLISQLRLSSRSRTFFFDHIVFDFKISKNWQTQIQKSIFFLAWSANLSLLNLSAFNIPVGIRMSQ